jgi:hypothetical protein
MTNGSYHHFPALVDVIRYVEIPEARGKGDDSLLVFADENGAQVTIRLPRTTADRLSRILAAGPTKVPLQTQ